MVFACIRNKQKTKTTKNVGLNIYYIWTEVMYLLFKNQSACVEFQYQQMADDSALDHFKYAAYRMEAGGICTGTRASTD